MTIALHEPAPFYPRDRHHSHCRYNDVQGFEPPKVQGRTDSIQQAKAAYEVETPRKYVAAADWAVTHGAQSVQYTEQRRSKTQPSRSARPPSANG
jgi:hypothetical protein